MKTAQMWTQCPRTATTGSQTPCHPDGQILKSWHDWAVQNTLWNLCAETSSIYLSIAYIYYDSFRFLHEASYPVKPSKNSLQITSQDSIGAFLLQNNREKRKPLLFLSASSRFITKQRSDTKKKDVVYLNQRTVLIQLHPEIAWVHFSYKTERMKLVLLFPSWASSRFINKQRDTNLQIQCSSNNRSKVRTNKGSKGYKIRLDWVMIMMLRITLVC